MSLWDEVTSRLGRLTGRDDGARTDGLALVYRGPASSPGCAEDVAAVLDRAGLEPRYVGPRERLRLTPQTLAGAALYAHPGGPDLDVSWRHMAPHRKTIRHYVRDGGNYLGFCLGGYLAGSDPGFDLLPGDTDQYIGTKGASVCHDGDDVVTVSWKGQQRDLYFQDGPYFDVKRSRVQVLARYDNDRIAAMTCRFGEGRVAVVGPHPEATPSWFTDVGLTPVAPATDLALDLVAALRA